MTDEQAERWIEAAEIVRRGVVGRLRDTEAGDITLEELEACARILDIACHTVEAVAYVGLRGLELAIEHEKMEAGCCEIEVTEDEEADGCGDGERPAPADENKG